MKLKLQFAGYDAVEVDTDNATCHVFEKLPTASEAARQLEEAAMGDPDDNGWIACTIGGEPIRVKRVG